MHIISRKKLLEAGKRYGPKAATQLDSWYRIAKASDWRSLEDIRRTYCRTDGVTVGTGAQKKVYIVFDIGGNEFRLIAEIFYRDQTLLIRHVLTHAEYDKEKWKI